jgi:hypothetical protein
MDMKLKMPDFRDAQDILRNLDNGQMTRRDLVALLIYIREHIPADIIRDIADGVAHSDRKKGYSYAFIEKFVSGLVRTANKGGSITVAPIFKRAQIVSRLSKDLDSLNLGITTEQIDRRYDLIETCLRDILDDTSIRLTHRNVESAVFKKETLDGEDVLVLMVLFKDIKPGVLNIPPGTRMAFPVFER